MCSHAQRELAGSAAERRAGTRSTIRRAGPIPLCLLAVLNWLTSCVSVKPVIVTRKTQLENQILGQFQRLEQELVLASSVRGDRKKPEAGSAARQRAFAALLSREFNRDDVDALKAKALVGEGRLGLLVVIGTISEATEARQMRELVDQENSDRRVLMQRVIEISPDLSEKNLTLVQQVFRRMAAQNAHTGHRVQSDDGTWRTITRRNPSAN